MYQSNTSMRLICKVQGPSPTCEPRWYIGTVIPLSVVMHYVAVLLLHCA